MSYTLYKLNVETLFFALWRDGRIYLQVITVLRPIIIVVVTICHPRRKENLLLH